MTTAPTRPAILTPEQRRVAAQLVYGMPNVAIARKVSLSVDGVASHLSSARRRLGCPGSSRAVLVHALLTAREVPPPASLTPAPDLTEIERKTICAIAEHTRNADIGNVIGVSPDDVRAEIDAVIVKAAADSAAHLIGLAHTWGILGDTTSRSASSTAGPV
ncbi:LuxR C-terminal-related transcriptional regulator [Streptomyces sp. NPDC049597]|uniref:LuxR C-terminal-related transcriptional regulator n=1 Tax=Streptomyces sp. NPDC049597 TaxID=3155276 RepID=UPI0034157836